MDGCEGEMSHVAPTRRPFRVMDTRSSDAIEVLQLAKTYPGGVTAVKGIDFTVAPGEVFGLLGPNGAGKSTTVGMLTTTVRPTAGRAWVAGCDVVSDPIGVRRRSAVVFQEPVVDRPLTGRHNLTVHARLWRLSRDHVDRRVADVVSAFGLGKIVDRPVETYSGGERRRLEIARALLSEPEVLFLDEPTVGLDPRMRHELLDLIAGLRARSAMTIVLTTHYLDEAEELCDRVAIVHEGQVVALDTPAALLARVGREMVEVRVDDDPDHALRALRAGGVATDGAFVIGATIHLPVNGRSARDVTAALPDAGLATSRVTTRPPTLDDVYLQLTGSSLAA